MYKDLVDRNDSAPGVRARKERQSISDFRSLNTENRKDSPKKPKVKIRKRKSNDPFQNFNMPLERF